MASSGAKQVVNNTSGGYYTNVPSTSTIPSGLLGGSVVGSQVTFPWTPDPPKPISLGVVRLVCWKCAKDEGKFLLEAPPYGTANVWCEECYCVKQLGGPPEAK